jgi:hypothetical protein
MFVRSTGPRELAWLLKERLAVRIEAGPSRAPMCVDAVPSKQTEHTATSSCSKSSARVEDRIPNRVGPFAHHGGKG